MAYVPTKFHWDILKNERNITIVLQKNLYYYYYVDNN